MSVASLRYAHALAQVVAAQKLDATAVQQQLSDFSETLKGSRELREVLMNPAIPSEQKLRVVDALAGKLNMLPHVRNFVAVVMDHQRLAEFEEIVGEYHVIADESSGFTEAEIISARKLEGEDRAGIEQQVEKLVGGKVRATYNEDPSLLGGVVVKVGSTVYDGSVRAQLQKLKQSLVSA
jgi:F-type H+-transporting ATPase subunit delta